MSCTIIRPHDHQEWLNLRKQGIGSSEVGTILGVNPYETPYQLWRRKMGFDPAVEETFAMKAGHYLEDAVSMFFADATGYEIDKGSAGDWLAVSDAKSFMRVSPDRIYLKGGNTDKGILECKTTQMDIERDDVPQHWFAQLQYQLGVAEIQQGSLAWLISGRKFGYKEYAFNQEFFEMLSERVERFWVDNILGQQAPEAANVDDIVLRSPRHVVGKMASATPELIEACAEIKQLKDERAAMNERKIALESQVKMAMDDAESLVASDMSGKPVVLATWKAAKDSLKFQEKMFAADHSELYQSYLLPQVGTRRFLIK